MFCGECGAKGEGRFCGDCGAPMKAAPTPAKAPAEAAPAPGRLEGDDMVLPAYQLRYEQQQPAAAGQAERPARVHEVFGVGIGAKGMRDEQGAQIQAAKEDMVDPAEWLASLGPDFVQYKDKFAGLDAEGLGRLGKAELDAMGIPMFHQMTIRKSLVQLKARLGRAQASGVSVVNKTIGDGRVCPACQQGFEAGQSPINVFGQLYHRPCLACSACRKRIYASQRFFKDGKGAAQCYDCFKQAGGKIQGRDVCLGCHEEIPFDEDYVGVNDGLFHQKCFVCSGCRGQPGAEGLVDVEGALWHSKCFRA